MSQDSILRIPRSDSSGDYALIKVSKSGASDLDLQLVGTEGETPYVGSLTSSGIKKLRAKNYRGDDDEWAGILSYSFDRIPESSANAEWISGLEVLAAVQGDGDEENKELHIALRKRIDSITDDEQAIELYEWTGMAVSKAKALEQQVSNLQSKYREAEDTINKLKAQLEDFIETKNRHDEQLIGKFVGLLNEKKSKIRSQQRLLTKAKENPDTAQEAATTEAPQKATGKSATSRRSKRKADEPPPEESESDDGFDAMDIDKKDATATLDEGSTTDERQDTPEPLEDETASEIEDEVPPRPPAPKKGGRAETIPRTAKAAVAQDAKRTRNAPELSANLEISEPPPPRELPFSKKRAAQKPVIESTEGGATDSEDDEL
ncbi:uncharacterized protein ARB_06910 [Trichophyton benhamiae CBS 112371]|uniref:XRCC4 coiled-coil domain-containing protein n=1 Tax=Arthroderma benhamiae (strain ATCC MYA-4681 / CBS 112371) TaxID=663331 RepID=D4AR80_ARTBC|nr:uncharacterized protein ARB_06910 [Trichophyton benhamiae CBS 112371]EFE34509.1 conserved hypothetical protein [Trichophyton benhamiae CBS 112371]